MNTQKLILLAKPQQRILFSIAALAGLLLVSLTIGSCTKEKKSRPSSPSRTRTVQKKPVEKLLLVKKGASLFVIYRPDSAPKSVNLAATELQEYIEKSTGVKLDVVNAPANPMICLGDNAASRKAGFSSEELSDESYRIVAKDGSLYILGVDWPDDDKKWFRCDSTGTLFGVYEFLEQVVGVRWLMPGELGEEVPDRNGELVVASIDVAGAPKVPHRSLHGVHERASSSDEARVWLRRMRMGRSINPSWGHNFDSHPPTEVLLAHPEYMPLQPDGTREKPVGDRSWGKYEHKFCLSNDGLIRAFAESLMKTVEKYPDRHGLSMGPADGGRWCVCPECKKFKLTDTSGPWGKFPPYGHSVTPIVLRFYNGVARIIGRKYPDRLVGGLAYHNYVYPPYEPVKIEPNVFVGIAINAGYGYKFYQPERAQRVKKIIRGWSKLAPHLGWSDYSTWMRNPCGAPLPPGLPILKTIFPAFGDSLKVIHYQGQSAWGYGAAHNYVVARLIWDNSCDIDALYGEFLERAYGPAAGTIRQLYATVEESLKKYIVGKRYSDHEIWYEEAKQIYAPIFHELEKLYRRALGQAETEAQRKRIEMLGDNLLMLHWNLRHSKLISEPEKSSLYMPDEAYEKFLEERTGGLSIVNLKWFEKYRWQTALYVPEERSLTIPRLPEGITAPKLDGDLSDAAWKTAAVADEFRMNQWRRGPARWQTTARVTYDDTYLYVAYTCSEPNTSKIITNCKVQGSSSILKDDVVELYLQIGKRNVTHIAVSAANVGYVNGKVSAKSAASIRRDSWTVELAVPFAQLPGAKTPSRGTVWRGNLSRRRVGPPIERSTWCRVDERIAEPRCFGKLVFAGPGEKRAHRGGSM